MVVDSLVGWVGLALTIASMVKSGDVPNANIRVKFQTGMNGHQGLSGADGELPSIELRDTSGRDLGFMNQKHSDPRKIGSDKYYNYDIWSHDAGELKTLDLKMQGFRTSIDNGDVDWLPLNDAICLAYMSWTPEDTMFNHEFRSGAITGDLFWWCGYDWTFSGKTVNGQDVRCGWLDGDNTTGNSASGIFINTDIMGKGALEKYVERNQGQQICTQGVSFHKGPSRRKRALTKDTFGNKAYVTSRGGAIELCDSPTSWGRSMLSLKEGIFCDMVTKTKVPLCKEGQTEGCFKYNRGMKANRAAVRSMTYSKPAIKSGVSVSASLDLSHESYDLEYFVVSDVNGTVIDDGTGV